MNKHTRSVSLIDGHIEDKDNEIFANEILCIKRRASGMCNGGTDCNTCDLLMNETEILEAYQRAMKQNDLIKQQQAEIKQLETIERVATKTIEKQDAEIERLNYIIMGVMHSVDKWLDGDELKQDEVNRAAAMREKTLRIVEAKQAEVTELQSKNSELEIELKAMRGAANSYTAEIERLNGLLIENDKAFNKMTELYNKAFNRCKTAKSEAIKEFAELLKGKRYGGTYPYVLVNDIDNLVKEMTEVRE